MILRVACLMTMSGSELALELQLAPYDHVLAPQGHVLERSCEVASVETSIGRGPRETRSLSAVWAGFQGHFHDSSIVPFVVDRSHSRLRNCSAAGCICRTSLRAKHRPQPELR